MSRPVGARDKDPVAVTLGRREAFVSEIRFPVRGGRWTLEHVGPGGGVLVLTEDLGGRFSMVFTAPERPPIEESHHGPMEEAQRRADAMVRNTGHSCVAGCQKWPAPPD